MSFKDEGAPENRHLSPEELRAALLHGTAESSPHLQSCNECAAMLRRLQVLSVPSVSGDENCIAIEALVSLAGERSIADDRQLEHLAACGRCAGILKGLIDDLSDESLKELPALASSSPQWQRSVARQMATAVSPIRTGRKSPKASWWRWAWATAAIAIVAVFSIAILRTRPNENALLARAFEKRRLTAMRIEGAHYSPLATTRGSVSMGELPSEELQAAAIAKKHLESDPTSAYWHGIQGDVYLLEGSPQRAASEYRIARAADASNTKYELLLGSALCDNAIQNGESADYVEGLNSLRTYVQRNAQDSVGLYNLGTCLYHAGLLNEARNYLEKAAASESDSSWKADVQRLLTEIDQRLRSSASSSSPDFGRDLPAEFPSQLRAAAEDNTAGRAAEALEEARAAELLERNHKDSIALAWSKYEQAYAEQRLSQGRPCLQAVDSGLSITSLAGSSDLRAALLTEAGICNEFLGDFQTAQQFYARALAENTSNRSLRMRMSGMQAGLLNTEGRHRESEAIDLEALSANGNDSLNAMRRYQFLSDLYFNAVADEFFFAAYEFEREAVGHAKRAGNIAVGAAAHEDLAEDCLRIGDVACTGEERTRAESLLASLNSGDSELYKATWSLRRELIAPDSQGGNGQPVEDQVSASLQQSHYLGLPVLQLRAKRALRNGDLDRAEHAAMDAAKFVISKRQSLTDDQTRFTWVTEASPVFQLLVQVQLARHNLGGALACWESFQAMTRGTDVGVCSSQAVPRTPGTALIFARLEQEYVRWTVSSEGQIDEENIGPAARINDLARILAFLCSQVDSPLREVQSVSDAISQALLPAGIDWQRTSLLVIEPDAGLSRLPFRALRVGNSWLGLSHAVSLIPGLWAVRPFTPERGSASTRLVLTGSERADQWTESTVARSLGYSVESLNSFSLLSSRIDAAQFVYYVGHATNGGATQAALAMPARLHKCRFVVLAACETKGETENDSSGFGRLPDRLLEAGALEVIASRWNVDSAQTETLLEPILRAAELNDSAEKLRSASQALNNSGLSHPYYWAGFDVYGVPEMEKGGKL